jgi:glycosyltransferase involved in cell wall biosynthesis
LLQDTTEPRPPLRVLHLCAGNLYGGVERIVAECAASRALTPAMTPAFAVCFDARLAREIDEAGARCARLGPVRVSRPWTVAKARRRLAAILESDRPHAVICHSSWMFALAAPVIRTAGGSATLALWLHDRVSGRTWPERWARMTVPDLVVSNSRFTDETVGTMYPVVPRAVVYAPVAPAESLSNDERRAFRKALGAAGDAPVVLMACRFEAWKGHQDLLAAISGIADPWRLWIAGGPQRSTEEDYLRLLRTRVASLGIADRVSFIGERPDIPAVMRAADVLCQPNSGPEPFGIAFVEALHAGLPVVTTAIGGALEIVTDACGRLVPPADPAALEAALRRLLTDATLRQRLGAAGPARAAALCDPMRQLNRLAALLSGAPAAEVPA